MEDPRWLEPPEARAWRGWLAASELVRAQMGRDLQADSGLSEADYTVLVYLSEAVDPDSGERRVRMTDLAAALRWSKSRLSHQVGRMESRGLLAREGCPSDARGSFATLTATGLREIERASPSHVASVRRNFIDLLTAEQLVSLAEISETLIQHLLSLPDAPAAPAACPGVGAQLEAQAPTRQVGEGKLVG